MKDGIYLLRFPDGTLDLATYSNGDWQYFGGDEVSREPEGTVICGPVQPVDFLVFHPDMWKAKET